MSTVVSQSVAVVFVFEQSEPASAPLELVLDFFLHQVEAHGDQRESEGQPQRTDDELLSAGPLLHAGARHDVAEADGGQRDEAEIGPRQVVPVLP